ncbi:MAG: GC-type dockerin domain-anchored protein [Planctomycetota bacterium]
MKTLLIGAAFAIASAAVAHAQDTWFVDADAPTGGDGLSWATAFDDLQPAMELALPGDEIWLAEGVYVPSVIDPIAGEDQPYFLMPDGVALLGGFRGDETSADQRDPAEFESVISGDLLGNDLDTPISGAFDSSPEMQALYQSKLDNTGTLLFVDRTGPGTRLDGLVFENSFRDGPASGDSPSNENGVFVLGAILDIIGCTFRDNIGYPGGALYVLDCDAGRLSSEFASIHPCGLVSFGQPSAVLIQDSEFIDNIDLFGETASGSIGAAAAFFDSLVLWERTSVRFSRLPDVTSESTGSIWSQPGAWFRGDTNATVLDSVFERCSPHIVPGGIFVSNGVSSIGAGTRGVIEATLLDVTGCVFKNNIAAPFGVVRYWGGAGAVSRSMFLGNQRYGDRFVSPPASGVAVGGVGSFFGDFPGFLSVIDNVFVGNRALSLDSGFPSDSALEVSIVSSFLRNGAIERNSFAANETLGELLRLPDSGEPVDNTIVRDNLLETVGASLDPLFVRNPDDGGDGFGDDPATPDVDESLNDDYGDLRLRAGSPAIDAGETFLDFGTIVDLTGNDRYVDDPGIPGAFIDLGAYEFQGVTCLPDVNQNGVLSPNDFNAWVLAFNTGSPLADQNRDGELSPDDFNAWVLNFNAGCP